MTASHDNAGIAAWKFKMLHEIDSYRACELVMQHAAANNVADGFIKIGPKMTLIHEGHPLDGWSEGDKPRECPVCHGYTLMNVCAKCGYEGGTRSYAVELYSTKIIRYYPDGTFSVDSGGFNIPTTRERLNAVLPARYGRWQGGNGAAYFKDKKLGVAGLWPLDHSVRINAETGEIVTTIANRLEYLRGEIRAERISYGEIAELQGLAEHIESADVELLEWAGVPEHDEEETE